MPLSPGDLLANKYRIEAEIGRGAFGRVYRARDIALDRLVAIKELHKGEDDLGSTQFSDYVRRFEREARVQARFNHPNIVHVYELLRLADDRLYLAMEYVDGGSLRDHLARRGPLPVDEAVRIMLDLLAGLAVVHADERDIVHRDVKPSNVMLTKGDQAKLADFGLAQVGDESLRSGAGQPHPGSPMYMSPEQETTSAYLYPASDVFSAGCVLFELLTGAVYKQAKRRKQELTNLRAQTPEWLVEVVARALAREADDRCADAGKMAAGLAAGQAKDRAEVEAKALAETPRLAEKERKEQAAAEARRREAEAEAARQAELRRKEQEAEQARLRQEQGQVEARVKATERERKALLLELAPSVTLEMMQVPAGEFLMGSNMMIDPQAQESEFPQHRLDLPDFLIGVYPVTVAQFAAFVNFSRYKTTAERSGYGYSFRDHEFDRITGACWRQPRGHGSNVRDKADHPVTLVSWDDAVAFCRWASKVTGRMIRLPSEAEWEKAARGTDGRLYPWGNQAPTDRLCNFNENEKDTTPVGCYSPAGDSPYGCADMAGNVMEWTASLWRKRKDGPTYGYPYVARDGREKPATGRDMWHLVRGGTFIHDSQTVRCAYRHWAPSDGSLCFVGFRVASAASPAN